MTRNKLYKKRIEQNLCEFPLSGTPVFQASVLKSRIRTVAGTVRDELLNASSSSGELARQSYATRGAYCVEKRREIV